MGGALGFGGTPGQPGSGANPAAEHLSSQHLLAPPVDVSAVVDGQNKDRSPILVDAEHDPVVTAASASVGSQCAV
jgi:hypothetical protein